MFIANIYNAQNYAVSEYLLTKIYVENNNRPRSDSSPQ